MVSAVILAAGLSSRMKDFKPLLPFGGSTVIQHTVSRLLEGGAEDLVVVTGFLAPEIERLFSDARVRFVHNRDYARSQMFDSARMGLAAAEGEEIFLLPADLPQFDPDLLGQLSAVEAQAAYPVCRGRNGHPLLLRREALETVFLHDGRRGLKGALDWVETRTLETEDEGCILDIDTAEDYCLLLKYRRASVPTAGEREEIFHLFEAPERARAHGAAVCRTALELAEGVSGVNLPLLAAAALLHDAAKRGRDHPEVLALELERRGYDRIASVVRTHMDLPEEMSETLNEHSLLYLADKLVKEERYVGLEERFCASELRFRDRPEVLAAVRRRKAVAQKLLEKVPKLHSIDD